MNTDNPFAMFGKTIAAISAAFVGVVAIGLFFFAAGYVVYEIVDFILW